MEQVEPVRPVLRVVSGQPSAEELAALIAVVSSLGTAPAPPAPAPSYWRGNHRRSWLASQRTHTSHA